jgi:hypothetical protein
MGTAIVIAATPLAATTRPNGWRSPNRASSPNPSASSARAIAATNDPRQARYSPSRTVIPAHSVNAVLARIRVTELGRSRSVGWRISSPPAAIVFNSQKPTIVRIATGTDDPPTALDATCGAASRNASGGSQTHVRNSAIAVVPTSATPRNTIVRSVGEAPSRGGEISTDTSPNAATSSESCRIAMTAATIEVRSAAATPASDGIRPKRRVAANRDSETIARPTARRT